MFKTIKVFVDEILAEIVSKTNKIKNPVDGSVIKSLIEGICSSLFFIQTMIKKVYRSLYVESAEGLFLDAKAKDLLMERKLATYATTFIHIVRSDDSQDEVLPSGTICLTESTPFNERKKYILQSDIKFITGVSEMDGVVQSEVIGTHGNTLADTIITIQNNTIGITSITNVYDVVNGCDAEIDDELRERIELKQLSLLGANERVIRSAALEVEGIIYTFLSNDKVNPGISYLFVNNKAGNIDESFISEVRDKVNEVRAMSSMINISRSPVNNISIYVKVKLVNNFLDNNIANEIKNEISNFVNSLKPSQKLMRSDIIGFLESLVSVDYVVEETINGQDQFLLKFNGLYKSIEDVNSIQMIRTTNSLITVEIME